MTNRLRQLLFATILAPLALVLLLTVLRPIQAAPPPWPLLVPGNPVTHPVSNTHTAPVTTTVYITYDEAISAATVSTETFAVHAVQTGLLSQTYSVDGGTITLAPTQSLKPGELVQVSATTGTLNLAGEGPIYPTVWQFWAAVEGGSGIFIDSNQNLGSLPSLDIALGDLDGDGDLDAFVGNGEEPHGEPNKVWFNDGIGNFADSGQNLGNATTWSIGLGDMDRDGDLDAFAANYVGHANALWLNDGDGNFTDSGQSFTSSSSQGVDVGDMDGDGDLDAFIANAGANHVWLNDGTGGFIDSGQSLGDSDSVSVVLGDLDGDGDLDAFVANNGPNKLWRNNGMGMFVEIQSLGSSFSFDVALGDLDHDGDLDAFVGNSENQAEKVWVNNGAGTFTDSGQNLGSADSEDVELADLDGDGDLDAFVADHRQANKVWLNDGTGNFTDTGQNLGDSFSSAVALGDLDGDGDLDAFVGNDGLAANKVWLNVSIVYLPLILKNPLP